VANKGAPHLPPRKREVRNWFGNAPRNDTLKRKCREKISRGDQGRAQPQVLSAERKTFVGGNGGHGIDQKLQGVDASSQNASFKSPRTKQQEKRKY